MMDDWRSERGRGMGRSSGRKEGRDSPRSALALAEIIAKSRIPRGVVNVLAGPGGSVGEALCKHEGVDKIAFTGSTEVGRRILEMAAQGIKKATMELGGKSANIILDDANLD